MAIPATTRGVAPRPGRLRFDEFELDAESGELFKGTTRIPIQEQPLIVLRALLERPGAVVTREELYRLLWPADVHVDFERGLNAGVKRLRVALDDPADAPRIIETLPRRGYRLKCEVRAPSETSRAVTIEQGRRGRRRLALWAVAVATLVALTYVGISSRRASKPRITRYAPILERHIQFPPFPSEYPILTDGPRIYFPEFIDGRLLPRQASVSGGDPAPVPVSVADHHIVADLSPDGTQMLIGAFDDVANETVLNGEVPLWITSTTGGAPRRLGAVTGHATAWLRDGRILVAHGSRFFSVNQDGSDRRDLFSAPGRPYWLKISPDGKRLRFSLFEGPFALRVWESRLDGSGIRPLFEGWGNPPNECCGDWTADGRYFVFQAVRDGLAHLWAVDERDGPTAAPFRLTDGPVQYRRPAPSRDGRTIYSIGWQLRGELTVLDPSRPPQQAHPAGISGEHAVYSSEGTWLAYVGYPDGGLWRVRADGSERLRLTRPPLTAMRPQWSADNRVAFTGFPDGRRARVMLADLNGMAITDLGEGGLPTWAPDGTKLALWKAGRLFTLTMADRELELIPGSEKLLYPAWSPDGKYLAAIEWGQSARLYDFSRRSWRDLAKGVWASPNWSADSRYLYLLNFRSFSADRLGIYRVRLADSRVEPVTTLADERPVWGCSATGSPSHLATKSSI
jgi:DNA-binding winged helix-turn-helix (wHTH) protein/Tol biopolymer transport system component